MKRITLLIVLTLVAGNAYAISGKALNEAQAIKIKADQEQQAEAARLKAIADQELFLKENTGTNKAGFESTVKSISKLEKDIQFMPSYLKTMELLNCSGTGYVARLCIDTAIAWGNAMGGEINWGAGIAKIVNGAELIEIKNKKLFSFMHQGTNNLMTTIVFNKFVSTVTVTDQKSYITFKANMFEPTKSQITDAALPLNAMNTITQLYNKRGINLSENMLFTLIEDWYRSDNSLIGIDFDVVAGSLISDRNARTNFLNFCKIKAKTATKPVDDDE